MLKGLFVLLLSEKQPKKLNNIRENTNRDTYQSFFHILKPIIYPNFRHLSIVVIWTLHWENHVKRDLSELWLFLVVHRIYPQNNKFAMSMENKATGDSKLNDSP